VANWFTRLLSGNAADEARSLTAENSWGVLPFAQDGPLAPRQMTQGRALSLASVYAANRLLGSTISTLPVKGYRRNGDQRDPMTGLPTLFDRLATSGELVPWLHRCVVSLGLRGNAFGLITARDGFGFPTAIQWLNPADVRDDGNIVRPQFFIGNDPLPRDQVVHIPWFTLPGQVQGLSPIGAFAQTLGVGLQAQQYASDWFAVGGFPPGTFKNVDKDIVSQDEANAIKARLTSAIKTREPIVYGKGWEYNPISVPPNEAQFIETMKMSTNQVASIYGIPAEMIGGETGSSMTYANVEQQALNFVMFSLRPWLVMLETAFSALLPDRQYVKFNADALVRADMKTRHEVYEIDRRIGLRNLDEIRALEELSPLPRGAGGTDYLPPAPAPAQPADDEADAQQRNGWRPPT
jgi:HK97 family phage portal protein